MGRLETFTSFLSECLVFFCNFLFEVPTGAVADFLGRKTSLALGALLGGIAAFLYTSRPLLAVFVVAEAVFALAFTFQSGADEALAYDSLKAIGKQKDSKRILSRMESFKLGDFVRFLNRRVYRGPVGIDRPFKGDGHRDFSFILPRPLGQGTRCPGPDIKKGLLWEGSQGRNPFFHGT